MINGYSIEYVAVYSVFVDENRSERAIGKLNLFFDNKILKPVYKVVDSSIVNKRFLERFLKVTSNFGNRYGYDRFST